MSVVERYLELGQRVGKHVDDLVESYHGPPEISERVEVEDPLPPETLIEHAAALLDDLARADLELARRRWLEAQVRSLQATARRAAGESMPYAEEVQLMFGIEPRWHDEEEFARGRELLDEALPGNESLETRFADWLEGTAIPKEVLLQALQSMTDDLRERTRDLVGLPDGEEFELELVTGKNWSGYNLSIDGLRSRVSVNTDLPFPAANLGHMMAHEGYPGHHTEGAWKEQVLVRERGRLEYTLVLLCAPAAVVAEGIAEIARELVFDSDEQEVIARHLRPLGIEHDAELAARVDHARDLLNGVPANLALLRFAEGKSRDEAREYARRWLPHPPERVEKTLDFIDDGPFPGYVHCYPEGLRLAREFVQGDVPRFKELLTGQFVPVDLENRSGTVARID
jgi:hypothetical protein